MNSSAKNYLIVFLFVALVGGGALAWPRYLELITFRAAAIDPKDRAAEAARLAAAQRYAHELEDQLASRRDANPAASDSAAAQNPGNRDNGGRGRGGPANFRALTDNPEARKLMTQQQRTALDTRYAALFKTLGLPAAQLESLKSQLLEKQSTIQDVLAAAREQGLDPRSDPDGFRKLIATTEAGLDANLEAMLGDEAFAQYQQYQQSQPQRNVVNQLQQSLSYTDAPLTDAQASQLAQILASTATQMAGGPPADRGGGPPDGGGPQGGGGNGPSALITSQTIAQAQTVLSATQVQALQQLQQTQQAQQQLGQLLRNSGGSAQTRNASRGV